MLTFKGSERGRYWYKWMKDGKTRFRSNAGYASENRARHAWEEVLEEVVLDWDNSDGLVTLHDVSKRTGIDGNEIYELTNGMGWHQYGDEYVCVGSVAKLLIDHYRLLVEHEALKTSVNNYSDRARKRRGENEALIAENNELRREILSYKLTGVRRWYQLWKRQVK